MTRAASRLVSLKRSNYSGPLDSSFENMSEEIEVLKTVTGGLNQVNIPYIISGSMAANYYTVPRMTRDIDVILMLKMLDVDRFVKIFEEDFFIDKESLQEEIKRKGMFNCIHKKFIIKVDFILSKDTSFQDSTFLRRRDVLIDNERMWIISAEDLILAKLLWAKDSLSAFQLHDIRNLMSTVKNLDHGYIQKWVADLELSDIYQRIKHE